MKYLTHSVSTILLTGSLLTASSTAFAQIVPGDARSAGLYYIVPDVACWFNSSGNYVTNGFINTANAATPLNNWEPYTSVMGDTTFLVEFNIFANDGLLANQNHVVALQPANGAAAKLAYAYYDDSGVPFMGKVDLSRQDGNPGRVAGDKRTGATNYITECEVSIGQLVGFQSDTRWNNNPIASGGAGDDRYVAEQIFGLNPTTLTATPLHKAWDYVYGPFVTGVPPASTAEVSRTGGRADFLSNGNIVVMIDDKTKYVDSVNGEVVTFAVITPAGTIVKGPTESFPGNIFDNMCAFNGGFCIRAQHAIQFYDNSGNLIFSNDLAVATANLQAASPAGWGFTGAYDTGRGDGQHVAADIRSPYVYLAGAVTVGTGSNACMMAVWNGQTGAFITNVMVSADLDPAFLSVDRAALACDMSNRVCVAFAGQADRTAGYQNQVIAQVMQFTGSGVKYLCPSFFAFLNSDNSFSVSSNGLPVGFTTFDPNVSMTTKAICIAAKGSINSTNNPYNSGPDSPLQTTVYTVLGMPLGGPDSVGLSYIQADMALWWNDIGNYQSNGPITLYMQTNLVANGSSWEPYTAVMGDSTFLISFDTFANDGTATTSLANENTVVAKQPAAGGAPVLGYAYYDDSGVPFKGNLNLRRRTGNPSRVAADLRYGATKFINEMETSVGQFANFQSNTRWNNNNIYQGTDAYCTEQLFNLNPTTLVQTPITNAWDYVYGDYVGVMGAANGADQCSRTGGRPNFLDNGNIVVMEDDKQAIASTQGEVCTFRIIKPDGTLVGSPVLVNPGVLQPFGTPGSGGLPGYDIWDNMCAFRGGFAIRLHQYLYFFDNNGNQTFTDTNIVQSTGLSFGTGREDASRIASDIRSYYVYLAGQTPEANPNGPVNLAIWDSRTGKVVTKTTVSQLDPSPGYARFDRTMIAVDASDRFCVAYKVAPDANFYPVPANPNWQVAARVGQFDGAAVTWLTSSFFPFVNHDPIGGTFDTAYITAEPHVSMTTRAICISAKGTINSTNNPSTSADTLANTALYTVITHPAPLAAPRPTMTITHSGSNVIISWNADAGLFTLVSSANAAAALSTWAAVSPQPATVGPANNQYSMTVPIGAGGVYFDLKR